MATVHFSPEAQNDLEQIKNYIQNDLENDTIFRMIWKTI